MSNSNISMHGEGGDTDVSIPYFIMPHKEYLTFYISC